MEILKMQVNRSNESLYPENKRKEELSKILGRNESDYSLRKVNHYEKS